MGWDHQMSKWVIIAHLRYNIPNVIWPPQKEIILSKIWYTSFSISLLTVYAIDHSVDLYRTPEIQSYEQMAYIE